MYFYLEWSRINDSYKKAWNGVRKDFPDFAECIRTETWKHQMRATTPVLLNLAEKSIDLCRTILFPLAFKRATSAAFDDDAEYLASIQRMMEVELFAPLYYHLLLTFAYNFLCDNLEAKKFREYCGMLYNHSSQYDYDKLSHSDDRMALNKCKQDYISARKDAFKKLYKSVSPLADRLSVKTNPLYGPHYWISKARLQKDGLPPPCAWFILSRVVPHENPLSFFGKNFEDEDQFVKLSELIRDSESLQGFLMTTSANDRDSLFSHPSAYRYTNTYDTFTVINRQKSNDCYRELGSCDYGIKKSNSRFTIPSNLQKTFNCYLLERTYHINALSTADYYLTNKLYPAGTHLDFFDVLLPTKLHECDMHGALIDFFVSRINEDWRHILAERYVRYWDNYAIPILESVFIFLMSDYFKCVEEVMDAISEAFPDEEPSGDSIYNRLNPVRFLIFEKPDEREAQEHKSDKRLREQHNKMVATVFSARA